MTFPITDPCSNVKSSKGKRWSDDEIDEVKHIFEKAVYKMKPPEHNEVKVGMERSRENNGIIHHRPISVVKIKIKELIIKRCVEYNRESRGSRDWHMSRVEQSELMASLPC